MSQSKLQYSSSKLGTKDKNNNFKVLNRKNEEIYAPNGSFFGATYKWFKNNKSFYNKTVKLLQCLKIGLLILIISTNF